jgi:solute carrier family 35 protein
MGLLSMAETERTARISQKVFAAAAYAVSSTAIMLVNKIVFTTYGLRSFLAVAMCQYAASIVVLSLQHRHSAVQFPLHGSWAHLRGVFWEIFPLPLLFFANTISGLGATQKLNMPVFVLLRRFSIVMTMALEGVYLGKRFSWTVRHSVALMVLGAVIASWGNWSIDLVGVVMILLNDAFTALQGVMLRKKMDEKEKGLGSHGIMFYSNLFSLPLVGVSILIEPHELLELRAFTGWTDPGFVFFLTCSSVMGFILNYSYFLCTKYNSALTTTVIGAGKNIFTSFIGMLFRDYHNTTPMMTGVIVSMIGSLIYNYAEWQRMQQGERQRVAGHKCDDARSDVLLESSEPLRPSKPLISATSDPSPQGATADADGTRASVICFLNVTPSPLTTPVVKDGGMMFEGSDGQQLRSSSPNCAVQHRPSARGQVDKWI